MNKRVSAYRIFRFFGFDEKSVYKILDKALLNKENITIKIYHHFPEIHVKIGLKRYDNESKGELDRISKDLSDLTGPYLFSTKEQTMEEIVGNLLTEQSLTISVAESCTGGRIGNLLTNVSGSSVYFLGGVIVYSNRSKEELLNVSKKTLKQYGSVSDPVAREMAEGVRRLFHSDLGLAVTGIAGPGGGSREKPVGTVHIGLSTKDETIFKRYLFHGTREQIKQHSSLMVLDWIRRYVNGISFIPGI